MAPARKAKTDTSTPERVQVLVRLPEDLHRRAKVAAAQDGTTLQSMVEQALAQALKGRRR